MSSSVRLGKLPCQPSVKQEMQAALAHPELQANSALAQVQSLLQRGLVAKPGFEKAATFDAFAWTPGADPQELRLYVQAPRDSVETPRIYWIEFWITPGDEWPCAHRFGIGGRRDTGHPQDRGELIIVDKLQCLESVEQQMDKELGCALEDATGTFGAAAFTAKEWFEGNYSPNGSGLIGDREIRWSEGPDPYERTVITTTVARHRSGERAFSLEWALSPRWGAFVRSFWTGDADDRPDPNLSGWRAWVNKVTGGRWF